MDSGKDFFFGTHFHFFGHNIWPFLGVIASFPESEFQRWEIPKLGFYRGTDQFSNARMMFSHNIVLQERLIGMKEGEAFKLAAQTQSYVKTSSLH
jgi:hypothetical protein